MKYKGRNIEIIESKKLFGKETLWIRFMADNSFAQVLREDLDEEDCHFRRLPPHFSNYRLKKRN